MRYELSPLRMSRHIFTEGSKISPHHCALPTEIPTTSVLFLCTPSMVSYLFIPYIGLCLRRLGIPLIFSLLIICSFVDFRLARNFSRLSLITPHNRATARIPIFSPTGWLAFRFAVNGEVGAVHKNVNFHAGYACGNKNVSQAFAP